MAQQRNQDHELPKIRCTKAEYAALSRAFRLWGPYTKALVLAMIRREDLIEDPAKKKWAVEARESKDAREK